MTNKSNSYTLTHRHTHTRPLCPKADPTLSNCRAPFNPPPPHQPHPPEPPHRRVNDLSTRRTSPWRPPKLCLLFSLGRKSGRHLLFHFSKILSFPFDSKSFISKNRIAGKTSSRVVAPIFWRHFFNHVTGFTTSLSTGGRGNDASSDVTAHRSHGKGGG